MPKKSPEPEKAAGARTYLTCGSSSSFNPPKVASASHASHSASPCMNMHRGNAKDNAFKTNCHKPKQEGLFKSSDNGTVHVHFADADNKTLVQMQQYDKKEDKHHLLSACAHDWAAVNEKILIPMFEQPRLLPNFFDLVQIKKVCLETAVPDDDHLGVKGVVRVLNIAFHKDVYIRWSLDQWKSMCDYRIAYMDSAKNTATDKFRFDICAPLKVGETLEFAVRYECLGKQYWDNNHGSNYRFLCKARHHGTKE